jgi:hypothetical protein
MLSRQLFSGKQMHELAMIADAQISDVDLHLLLCLFQKWNNNVCNPVPAVSDSHDETFSTLPAVFRVSCNTDASHCTES